MWRGSSGTYGEGIGRASTRSGRSRLGIDPPRMPPIAAAPKPLSSVQNTDQYVVVVTV